MADYSYVLFYIYGKDNNLWFHYSFTILLGFPFPTLYSDPRLLSLYRPQRLEVVRLLGRRLSPRSAAAAGRRRRRRRTTQVDNLPRRRLRSLVRAHRVQTQGSAKGAVRIKFSPSNTNLLFMS